MQTLASFRMSGRRPDDMRSVLQRQTALHRSRRRDDGPRQPGPYSSRDGSRHGGGGPWTRASLAPAVPAGLGRIARVRLARRQLAADRRGRRTRARSPAPRTRRPHAFLAAERRPRRATSRRSPRRSCRAATRPAHAKPRVVYFIDQVHAGAWAGGAQRFPRRAATTSRRAAHATTRAAAQFADLARRRPARVPAARRTHAVLRADALPDGRRPAGARRAYGGNREKSAGSWSASSTSTPGSRRSATTTRATQGFAPYATERPDRQT